MDNDLHKLKPKIEFRLKPLTGLRWLSGDNFNARLQQSYEITTFEDEIAISFHTEWRDVPTVAEASNG